MEPTLYWLTKGAVTVYLSHAEWDDFALALEYLNTLAGRLLDGWSNMNAFNSAVKPVRVRNE